MAKSTIFVECEVCGTETDCTMTREGMYVCSPLCKQIAEGTNTATPVDTMLRRSEREYICLEDSRR
jgi:NADH:ubiquinone oxidoreductase subunit F (NADH-binding)